MAKAKAKNKKKVVAKKPTKPAKAKAKATAKKVAKPAKKAAPKAAKKVTKPVKKAVKPAPKKAVKVKAEPKKAVVAKSNKPAVVNKPVAKQIEKPRVETKAVVPSVKQSRKSAEKKIIREELKPEPKHFYKTEVRNQVPVDTKPTKKLKNGMSELNLRYSDDELKEFKELIDRKLTAAREELANLKETLDNHTESQAGNKAWNMEEGTDTSEMEYLMNQISRQHQYIRNLELAMVRVENKTYGICRVTGKLIPKERLRVVPHATLSLEAKMHRKADAEESPAAGAGAPPSDFAEGFED